MRSVEAVMPSDSLERELLGGRRARVGWVCAGIDASNAIADILCRSCR